MTLTSAILKYLRPYRPLAATSLLLIVVSAVIGLAAPWPLKLLIDNVLGGLPLTGWGQTIFGGFGTGRSLLPYVVLAGLLVAIVDKAFNVLSNYVNTRLELKMILDFRSDLFDHVQKLSMAFHDKKKTGGFMMRINMSSGSVGGVTMMVPTLGQSALTLIGMFWLSYRMDRTLALLSLSVMPFLYYSTKYYLRTLVGRLKEVKRLEAASLQIVHEAVSMMRVILSFGRQTYEQDKFRKHGETAVAARVTVTTKQTLFTLAVHSTTAVGTALVLGVGASHVLDGTLTVGQLLVIMSYIAAVYQPLEAITSTLGQIRAQTVQLQMALELLEEEPGIIESPNAVEIGRARGQIVFENVSFAYDERQPTLKGLSFEASAGQVLAVVGPTGAGKSTLISLIPRFYDPAEGRVLLDGIDIRELTLDSLRRQISMVLQEPLLFSTTIGENIRYGRLDATDEEVEEAAKAANAHDFIMRLPDKYKTALGERGSRVSVGERQRITIARAFLKDAPILILDEPTSSIDSRTEAVILDALDRLMIGRTTIMIAHRLSTVRHADWTVVLNQGEIAEQGTPDDLLARQGLYAQLSEIQSRRAARRSRRQLGIVGEPVQDLK